jgi:hypothetical protein
MSDCSYEVDAFGGAATSFGGNIASMTALLPRTERSFKIRLCFERAKVGTGHE